MTAASRECAFLVEWWTPAADRGEYMGRWFEARGGEEARAHALTVVDHAWTARVRISRLVDDQPVSAVDADRAALEGWNADSAEQPDHSPGPQLPPRSPDDLRREIVCGCRDALVLGIRAGLLDRARVVILLHEVDRSFDPGMLDDGDED